VIDRFRRSHSVVALQPQSHHSRDCEQRLRRQRSADAISSDEQAQPPQPAPPSTAHQSVSSSRPSTVTTQNCITGTRAYYAEKENKQLQKLHDDCMNYCQPL